MLLSIFFKVLSEVFSEKIGLEGVVSSCAVGHHTSVFDISTYLPMYSLESSAVQLFHELLCHLCSEFSFVKLLLTRSSPNVSQEPVEIVWF